MRTPPSRIADRGLRIERQGSCNPQPAIKGDVMPMTPLQQKGWIPCPAGELGRLADRLRARRLRSLLLAAAGAVVTAAALGFGVAAVVSALNSGRPSAACPTVPCGSQSNPAPAPCSTTTP